MILGSRCTYDYVKISEGQSLTQKAKVCGSQKPSSVHVEGEARIQFITDRSRTGRGFHLTYEIQSCGGLINQDLAEIKSPAHTNGYLHNLNCTWTIQAPPGKVVELK